MKYLNDNFYLGYMLKLYYFGYSWVNQILTFISPVKFYFFKNMAAKKNVKGYTQCLALLIHDKLLLESAVLVSLPLFLSLPCLIPPPDTKLLC